MKQRQVAELASISPKIQPRLYSTQRPPCLSDFTALCSQAVTTEDYPLSTQVASRIPIYDLSKASLDSVSPSALQAEWHHILFSGPGVLVLKNMYPDRSLLQRVNQIYQTIISAEKENLSKGDHFSSSSTNDRIWNSFGKHGLLDPESFVEYYSNPWLALICDTWLGPAYRITAQVNVVRPGAAAQVSHRDYHLGFQTAAACEQVPIQMQIASQLLTLQGAVAHSDMPVESGSTRLLPFSQQFHEGYMAYRLPEFTQYFLENYVTLPLEIGDGLFFNPALFHAAGENRTTDVVRSANLLQVSSAFGKPMESLDTVSLIESCWRTLTQKFDKEGTSLYVEAVVAAVAEGYPFPTNLDRRPPAPGGMAPESEQDIVRSGLKEGWDVKRVVEALRKIKNDSKA